MQAPQLRQSAGLVSPLLHLSERIAVKNVSEDAAARQALAKVSGKEQAPCLVIGGETIQESADIVTRLVEAAAPL